MRPVRIIVVLLALALVATGCDEAFEEASSGIAGSDGGEPGTMSAAERAVATSAAVGPEGTQVVPTLPAPERRVELVAVDRWVPQGNTTVDGTTVVVDADGRWPDSTRTARVASDPAVAASPGDRWVGAVVMDRGVRFRAEIRFYSGSRILETVTSAPLIVSDGVAASTVEGVAPAGTDRVRLRAYLADVDYGERHRISSAALGVRPVDPATGPSTTSWTPLGNTLVDGTTIVVDRRGPYQDASRTARVGTTPHTLAGPGQAFAGSVVMSPGVRFRAELRFFDGSRIIDTVTTAPIIRADGRRASQVSATAPPGTDGVILRVYLADVDYGERHEIVAADLRRTGGPQRTVATSTTTTAPVPTTTAGVRLPAPTTTVRPPAPTTTAVPAPTTTAAPAPTTTRPAPTTTAPPPTTTARPSGPGQPPTAIPAGFPTASTTGIAGVGLSAGDLRPSGSIDVRQDGAVLDGLDVSGMIRVFADNVTIRNSRIRSGSAYGVAVQSGSTGLVVQDTTIIGTADASMANIGPGDYSCIRCDLSGAVDGAKLGSNVVIRASYIHDMRKFAGTHNDGIQNSGGGNHVLIEGNTILGPYRTSTSAIIAQTNVGPIDDMVVRGNYLYGGSYTVYLRDKGTGHGAPTRSAVVDNVFAGSTSGVFAACLGNTGDAVGCNTRGNTVSIADTVAWHGNRFHDGTPF